MMGYASLHPSYESVGITLRKLNLLVRMIFFLLLLVSGLVSANDDIACHSWSLWQSFKHGFMSDDGRIIDPSTPQQHSTSEGQSYALTFALIDNDRVAFEKILAWTEKNLAKGDLTAGLPAWQWGKKTDGSWGVLDTNPAADADLWIAYALLEAGRLWQERKYSVLGTLLAQRILREETQLLPGLGMTLLPAPHGFQLNEKTWQLNPSYVPLQLIERLAQVKSAPGWRELITPSYDLLIKSASNGFAPDWVLYSEQKNFHYSTSTTSIGSYNAIRVYLWAGMLADDDPHKTALLQNFLPMANYLVQQGTPPENIDVLQPTPGSAGPIGFSAALLPLLQALQKTALTEQQQMRIEAKPFAEIPTHYYDHVLGLFGVGWSQGLFRFDHDGQLIPTWSVNGSVNGGVKCTSSVDH